MKIMEMSQSSDAMLVAESLTGNREAFGQIVARYQTLICSLAYSRTGSLTQSDDLAQETFITAWKELGKLHEPEKLRSWLCTIARNLTYDALKREGREPSHAAENLDALHESPAVEQSPDDRAISKEEADILWRSLGRIPETYREPLILFYREQQSIQAVAVKLELSEDAVKQRLSRGRKLLQEEVVDFVENALARTNPSTAFTLSVMGVLPGITLSAKAATLGAAAAKGSVAAKTAAATGLLSAFLGPLLSVFGAWLGYRMSQDVAQSDLEREFNKAFFKRLATLGGVVTIIFVALMLAGLTFAKTSPWLFVGLVLGLALLYLAFISAFSIWCYRARKKLLGEIAPREMVLKAMQPVWEYKSRFLLLGLPLIHIRIGDRLSVPIKAWVAVGDCALGGLFAFGGLAVAPISIGGCAVGLFSFGGLALGALALGGMGIGVWSFGGLVIGFQAFGGCAIAWNAAWGGYAIARDFALGGIAHAAHANNHFVEQTLKANPFFNVSSKVLPHLFWLNLVWIIPMMIQRSVIRRQLQRKQKGS